MSPEKFLKELKVHNIEQYKIVSTIRKLILATDKNVSEEIKYGGLLYSNQKPYTGLFVSKKHVSMEFSEGASFTDPKKLLEGTGKYRRHLKFHALDEINETHIKSFLKQALSLVQAKL